MPLKQRRIYVSLFLLAFVFFAGPVFCEGSQESSSQAGKPSEQVEIKPENIEKTLPSYRLSLKKLIDEAEKNVCRIDAELKEREIEERNKEREAEARACFERGNVLYAEGNLEEAKAEWQKAIDITRDPQMKGYIRQSEQKAREEGRARKKEEAERQRALEAERREEERLERERRKAEELAKREIERQQRIEKVRLEREARDKARREAAAERETERLARREKQKAE